MKQITTVALLCTLLVGLVGPTTWGVSTAAAETPNSSLTEKPKEPYFAHGGWVMEGVGGIVVVAGTVLLALGYGSFADANQLREDNPNGEKNADADSLDGTGTALTTVGWISLGVGIAVMVGGSIWLLSKQTKEPSNATPQGTASLPQPKAAPQQGTVLWENR
ncbi:MAG: hypothetical protein EP343_32760 [Deltaproteobacteria bacterium]|nr:MAG: hypothetical protein EP343_32760 [Deltaproteobacteria bacterium]